jgi:hypothetical protein
VLLLGRRSQQQGQELMFTCTSITNPVNKNFLLTASIPVNMVFHTLILDGTNVTIIAFPDAETSKTWTELEVSIKDNAKTLYQYFNDAGERYDGMTAEHKEFGESWLNKVKQLRDMGFGVPPSIESSYQQYIAIKNGDEV